MSQQNDNLQNNRNQSNIPDDVNNRDQSNTPHRNPTELPRNIDGKNIVSRRVSLTEDGELDLSNALDIIEGSDDILWTQSCPSCCGDMGCSPLEQHQSGACICLCGGPYGETAEETAEFLTICLQQPPPGETDCSCGSWVNQSCGEWDCDITRMYQERNCTGACGGVVTKKCVDSTFCENAIWGCTDANACNYDPSASADDGSCQYSEEGYDCDGNCISEVDECGICGGSGPEENYDCDGNCLVDVDCLGVCGGSGPEENYDCDGNCTAGTDCAGECGGSAEIDDCGICGGSGPEENYDCDGNCLVDVDCLGECGGAAIEDECGVCNGDNSCVDCAGTPYGSKFIDCNNECGTTDIDDVGVCGGNDTESQLIWFTPFQANEWSYSEHDNKWNHWNYAPDAGGYPYYNTRKDPSEHWLNESPTFLVQSSIGSNPPSLTFVGQVPGDACTSYDDNDCIDSTGLLPYGTDETDGYRPFFKSDTKMYIERGPNVSVDFIARAYQSGGSNSNIVIDAFSTNPKIKVELGTQYSWPGGFNDASPTDGSPDECTIFNLDESLACYEAFNQFMTGYSVENGFYPPNCNTDSCDFYKQHNSLRERKITIYTDDSEYFGTATIYVKATVGPDVRMTSFEVEIEPPGGLGGSSLIGLDGDDIIKIMPEEYFNQPNQTMNMSLSNRGWYRWSGYQDIPNPESNFDIDEDGVDINYSVYYGFDSFTLRYSGDEFGSLVDDVRKFLCENVIGGETPCIRIVSNDCDGDNCFKYILEPDSESQEYDYIDYSLTLYYWPLIGSNLNSIPSNGKQITLILYDDGKNNPATSEKNISIQVSSDNICGENFCTYYSEDIGCTHPYGSNYDVSYNIPGDCNDLDNVDTGLTITDDLDIHDISPIGPRLSSQITLEKQELVASLFDEKKSKKTNFKIGACIRRYGDKFTRMQVITNNGYLYNHPDAQLTYPDTCGITEGTCFFTKIGSHGGGLIIPPPYDNQCEWYDFNLPLKVYNDEIIYTNTQGNTFESGHDNIITFRKTYGETIQLQKLRITADWANYSEEFTINSIRNNDITGLSTNAIINGCFDSCGGCNTNSNCGGNSQLNIFIDKEFFEEKELNYLGVDGDTYHTLKMTNNPTYGLVSNTVPSTHMGIPDWYVNSIKLSSDNNIDTSFHYYLNNVQDSDLGDGIDYVFNAFCQPFNDIVTDSFTLQLDLYTKYKGNEYITQTDTNQTTISFDIYNDNEIYSCNNFVTNSSENIIDSVDIRIDQPSTPFDFDKVSGLMCSDGAPCTPEVIVDEIINSPKLGSGLISPADISVWEYEFIWPYEQGECSIELILDDAEVDTNNTSPKVSILEFDNGNGYVDVGPLSSGLGSSVYPGLDSERIHWVFTTGFAGGLTDEPNGVITFDYLNKTICNPGINKVKIKGEENIWVENIRVTNHNGICNDGSQCGLSTGGFSSLEQFNNSWKIAGGGSWITTTGPYGESAIKRTIAGAFSWTGVNTDQIDVYEPGDYVISFWYRNLHPDSYINIRQCSGSDHVGGDGTYVYSLETGCCSSWQGHQSLFDDDLSSDGEWKFYETIISVLQPGDDSNWSDSGVTCDIENCGSNTGGTSHYNEDGTFNYSVCTPQECSNSGGTVTTPQYYCPEPVTIYDTKISIRLYDRINTVGSEITQPRVTPLSDWTTYFDTINYEVIGWGAIVDNTVQQFLSGDNLNRCIAFGHCNQDGSLTRKGLISYDYAISVDLENSTGISAPFEGFNDIIIEGNNVDIGDFIESYFNSPTKTMAVSGYRNQDFNCCEPVDGSECFIAEQTNFKIDTLGIPSSLPINENLIDITEIDDFHGYNGTSVNPYHSPAIEIEDGFWKVNRVVGGGSDNEEYLMNVTHSIVGGETYTESFLLKSDSDITSLDISFFTNDNGDENPHHVVPATLEDMGNGIKKVYATWTSSDEHTTIRAIDFFPNMDDSWTWLAIKNIQLEQSNSPSPFHSTPSISEFITPPKTGLSLSGRILNSPLAFCNNDKFLIDSARGFGSDEYDSIFVIGGEHGAADTGHPTWLGDNDETGYYYSTLTEYDGWSTDHITIYPSNIGENTDTKLYLTAKRYFHNIYNDDSEVAAHSLEPIIINIIGINPPHIHFLKYNDESKTQIGVQSTLALSNQPTLKWYDNIGDDLISNEYLLETDNNVFINRNDNFGIKSIGNIDFSTYERKPDKQPRCSITLDGNIISKEFSAYNEIDTSDGSINYIWDNVIDAINNFNGQYSARLSDMSDSNPNSNLKTVLVEANKTGKEYDGVLDWTLDEDIVKSMESEPTFSNLVNGESYPIVHVYEDFGTIELFIAASDIDKFSQLSVQVISSNDSILAEITTSPYYINTTGISYGEIFNWDSYSYPFDDFVDSYDDVDLSSSISGDYSQSDLSHVNSKIILTSTAENFNGEVDISIRVTDNDSSYDNVIFKLIVHPVNDPPMIESIGDTNLFMNNANYPNDINIRIETSDTEEGICSNPIHLNKTDCENDFTCGTGATEHCVWITTNSIHLVDTAVVDNESNVEGSYCWKVQQAVNLITDNGNQIDAPEIVNGQTVLPSSLDGIAKCNQMIYCSTICYEEFGMSRENAEELCGFAAYAYDGSNTYVIGNSDVIACNDDVTYQTWGGSTSFRGGRESTCGSTQLDANGNVVFETDSDGSQTPVIVPNKTYVDLIYDVFNYYGATITTTACDSSYSEFVEDDSIFDRLDGTGCIHQSACESYMTLQVGMDSTQVGNICDDLTDYGATDVIGYDDFSNILINDNLNLSISVCNGGENNGKVCSSSADCPSYEVPNFLNFKNEDSEYNQFLTYSGFENLKNYVYVNPDQDSVGTSFLRISAKDGGLNEDGKYTHKRTGYSTVKVTISGSNQGPEGDLLKEEQASFGIVPDTFLWTISGNDTRTDIPQTLTRGKEFKIYDYHSDTTTDNRILDNCVTLGGKLNIDGECCKSTQETEIEDYYNTNNDLGGTNPVYYESEYIDELELYTEYFKGKHSRWCDIEFSTSWEYSDTFTNDNINGFKSPNSIYNELDYTKSYIFQIIDVVLNYDNLNYVDESTNTTIYQPNLDWWGRLGLDSGANPETGNSYWTDIWNNLYREGWDTFGKRDVTHPLGVGNKVVFTSALFTQGPETDDTFKQLLSTGFQYKFEYPSIYKAVVYATDSYGIVGDSWEALDLTNLVKFNQTVLFRYSPWQGLNVTGVTPMENTSTVIEEADKDKRPSLGLWYYDDMLGNKATDWFVRHGFTDPITGEQRHPYDDVEGGDFTTTYVQEEMCNNPIASGFGDTTPGGCEHDGKWKGAFYDNWETTPFLEFTPDTINFNYPTNYGPSTTSSASQYYQHNVTTWSCTSTSYDNQAECEDAGYTWESETNTVTNPNAHLMNFNGVFENIIQVPEAGRYTFEVYRDDGMTIEIDNVMVYNNWVPGNQGTDSYGTCVDYDCVTGDESLTVDLDAGNHNIKVKVYENKGLAAWRLRWYVESEDGENPDLGSNDNHIPTTDTSTGLLVDMEGVTLSKGYVLNSEDREDFYPDADVRNPISLGSSNAVLYKYYDIDLQPLAYEETSAPLTAQVFFYLRSTKNGFGDPVKLFEPTIVLEDEMQKGNMYVGFLDWGDGSEIEYNKEPFQLGHSTVLTHTYEESGIYEIKGDMFRVAVGTGDDLSTVEVEPSGSRVLGITNFKEFLLRINVSKNPDVEGEFKLLGGTGYDFIPYNETSPVISGISNYSLYKKQLDVMNGVLRKWTNEDTDSGDWEYKDERIPVKYKFIGEQLSSEMALANADEKLINPLVSAFTGSLASEIGLSTTDDVLLDIEDSACDFINDGTEEDKRFECTFEELELDSFYLSDYDGVEGVTSTYKAAFKDCEDECVFPVSADSVRGFYDGVVDAVTGQLVPDDTNYTQYQKPDGTYNDLGIPVTNTTTPRIVNFGVGTRFGELGNYLGDTDIGQVRYFDRPFDMWEMLGFGEESGIDLYYNAVEDTEFENVIDENHPGNPSSLRYWNNIIPEDYTLQYHRKGIGALPPLPDDSFADFFEIVFGWGIINNNPIEYNSKLYKTVQILFSKSSGDDITKIEMEFEGLTLRNDVLPVVDVFGGITTVDEDNNFSMITRDNILTLDFVEEFDSFNTVFNVDNFNYDNDNVNIQLISVDGHSAWYSSSFSVWVGSLVNETIYYNTDYIITNNSDTNPITYSYDYLTINGEEVEFVTISPGESVTVQFLSENQVTLSGTRTNELLINLPFTNREDKFGFKSIKVYRSGETGHEEISSADFYINQRYSQPYPYVSKYYGGIGNIVINEESPQTWIGYCDDDINITENSCTGNWIYPYYPVLPKINKLGKFDEERLGLMGEEWIPYGSPNISWNGDDEYAPISLTTLPEQWINYSLIDLDFSQIEDKALSDVGPINNQGILIDDYKIHFDGDGGIKLDKQKPMLRTKLGKTKKDKPY